MARNVYGLDLGTYEIKVYDKKNEKIWKEKDVIAVRNRKYVFAVGDEAYEMYEKAPSNIQVVFPMQNGVISHFEDMQYLLTEPAGSGPEVPAWFGICDRGADRRDGSGEEGVFRSGFLLRRTERREVKHRGAGDRRCGRARI